MKQVKIDYSVFKDNEKKSYLVMLWISTLNTGTLDIEIIWDWKILKVSWESCDFFNENIKWWEIKSLEIITDNYIFEQFKFEESIKFKTKLDSKRSYAKFEKWFLIIEVFEDDENWNKIKLI